jgi:hypothetical protein
VQVVLAPFPHHPVLQVALAKWGRSILQQPAAKFVLLFNYQGLGIGQQVVAKLANRKKDATLNALPSLIHHVATYTVTTPVLPL